ncbi:hypothetical protein SAY87_008442 [Trapa incisa]|uniref:RING-type domain-containing protein n=1 Tax=Trapa incisa TaxID=236973 RepID=A0AAN7KH70_9MYRT|nr:hypothetical protein SAY87_008442 [Trapa incisa]
MSYTTFNLHAWISPSNIDDQDEELILFSIKYVKSTQILVLDKEGDVKLERTNENYINEIINKYYDISQLTDFDSLFIGSEFTSLIEDIVPELWVEETAEQLAHTTNMLGNMLSNVNEEPLQVNINIDTVTVVQPQHGSHPTLVDYFHKKYANMKRSYAGTVYDRTIPFCSTELWLNEVEDDECCSICLKEFINGDGDGDGNDDSDDNDDSDSYSTKNIIRLPCSHKYHKRCISKWVKVNYVCPLCRFKIDDLVVVYPPVMKKPSNL